VGDGPNVWRRILLISARGSARLDKKEASMIQVLLSRLVYWLLTRAFMWKRLPHEIIRIDGVPYLTRFYLNGKVNSRTTGEQPQFFLHHFHKSDQGRELHNHPYTGTSLILAGGYIEERMSKVSANIDLFTDVSSATYLPGEVNVIGLEDFHRTDLINPKLGAWTLFVTGTRVSEWGFMNRDSLDYFPYRSKKDERIGAGPHARVKDAPNSELTERQRIDADAAARRAQAHEGTY
jgi:hypothetical protein